MEASAWWIGAGDLVGDPLRRCGGERSNKLGRYYASGPSSVVSSTGYGVGVRIGHSGQYQSWLATASRTAAVG
jgi:hypothetical protein